MVSDLTGTFFHLTLITSMYVGDRTSDDITSLMKIPWGNRRLVRYKIRLGSWQSNFFTVYQYDRIRKRHLYEYALVAVQRAHFPNCVQIPQRRRRKPKDTAGKHCSIYSFVLVTFNNKTLPTGSRVRAILYSIIRAPHKSTVQKLSITI